jgi:hypothetical protein
MDEVSQRLSQIAYEALDATASRSAPAERYLDLRARAAELNDFHRWITGDDFRTMFPDMDEIIAIQGMNASLPGEIRALQLTDLLRALGGWASGIAAGRSLDRQDDLPDVLFLDELPLGGSELA